MDPRTSFQLALSYRHKAKNLYLAAARGTPGEIDAETCRKHLVSADMVLKDLRAAERGKLRLMLGELERATARHDRLIAEVQEGRITGPEANKENRRALREVNALKGRIALAQACIRADDPAGAGGYLDLSLDAFADRLNLHPSTGKGRPRIARAALAGLATLLAFGAIYAGVVRWDGWTPGGNLRFEIRVADPSRGLIEVACRNEGATRALFHVPWPEQAPREPLAGDPRAFRIGIDVYVQETEGGPMRLFPGSEGSWNHLGFPLVERGPLEIPPGLSVTVAIDTQKLKNLGVDPIALRLVVSRTGGRELARFETPLPGH